MNAANRTLGRRGLGVAAALAAALAAIAVVGERRLTHGDAAAATALRALRVEVQRAERARVRLERDTGRAAALDASENDRRIAILEAVGRLATSTRVVLLGHALRSAEADPYGPGAVDALAGTTMEDGVPPVLRLTVRLQAVHAVRLVEAVATLRAALPDHPVDVAGCRIDRTHVAGAAVGSDASDASNGDGGNDGVLVMSCALDWHGWPA